MPRKRGIRGRRSVTQCLHDPADQPLFPLGSVRRESSARNTVIDPRMATGATHQPLHAIREFGRMSDGIGRPTEALVLRRTSAAWGRRQHAD